MKTRSVGALHWMKNRAPRPARLRFEPLEARQLLAADLIISELMAVNDTGLLDEDGRTSDWLEIFNRGDATADLDGYFLTDDPIDPMQWRLPAETLDPGQTLLVFASGKDRSVAGSQLHASFRLDGAGEYLALIAPDGATVVHEYAPHFPVQFDDVSFGVAQDVARTSLIAQGDTARVLVPSVANGGDLLGDTWTGGAEPFDDSTWTAGPTAVGFGAAQGVEPIGFWDLNGDFDTDVGPWTATVVNGGGAMTFQADVPAAIAGRVSQSLHFAAGNSSDYLDTDYQGVGGIEPRTVSFWLKAANGSARSALWSYGNGSTGQGSSHEFYNSNLYLYYEAGAGNTVVSGLPTDGSQWIHVAYVWQGDSGVIADNSRVYIDGVLSGTHGSNSPINTANSNFRIGRRYSDARYAQSTNLAEMAVWNRALTPTQIAALASGGDPLAVTESDVLGHWKLDDAGGTTAASAIASPLHDGTLVGNAAFTSADLAAVPGGNVSAVQFDGADDFIDTDLAGIGGSSARTVSAWVNTSNLAANKTIVGWGGSGTSARNTYRINHEASGTNGALRFEVAGGYAIGNAVVADGDWHHVVMTLPEGGSTNDVTFYVDGALDAQLGSFSGVNDVPVDTLTTDVRIGARAFDGQAEFVGRIDEVAIFNRDLDATEVARLFTSGVEGFTTSAAHDVSGDMFGTNGSALLRMPFTVADPAAVDVLELTMTYDDGFVAYVNGQQVAAANAPATPAWNSTATDWHAASGPEVFQIPVTPGLLNPGLDSENVLAIHGLNVAVDDADFFILPELDAVGIGGNDRFGYFTNPTPAAINGNLAVNVGPVIGQVTHTPNVPTDVDDVVVTAAVAPLADPIAAVSLVYRVMYGAETTIPMTDDGLAPDLIAGDGIFTALIPHTAAAPGEMIRWYVTADDTAAQTTRAPVWDTALVDRTNAPEYFGTIVDPQIVTAMPVLHWYLQPGTESAAGTRAGTRASLFYNGEFYDNVFVRVRGGSTTSLAKKSYKFDFNRGYHFRFDADAGRVSEININTTYTDKAYVRQSLTYDIYDAAGSPGSESFLVRMEQNGAFFSVAAFIEQPDEDLLDREGLDPNGALYKVFDTLNTGTVVVEKKTRKEEGNADINALVDAINTLSGQDRVNYLFDNLDVPTMANYMAATVVTQNGDQQAKNYYLYRDSDGSGEWMFLPWDTDLTFGRHYMTNDSILGDPLWATADNILGGAGANVPISPSHPLAGEQEHPANRSWNRLIDAMFDSPEFLEMFLRRLRTVMDLTLQDPSTPAGELTIEARLAQWATEIGPEVALDRAEWGWYGQTQTLQQAIDLLKSDYLDLRRPHLYTSHSVNMPAFPDNAGIPDAQIGNPTIAFGTIEGNPSSGIQDEEYIELQNPGAEAVDISGWQLVGGVTHTFRPGTVIRAGASMYVSPNVAAFRNRAATPTGGEGHFVQGGYAGHISNLGETIQLLAADGAPVASVVTPFIPSDAQRYLRISEIMYNPPAPTQDEIDAGFTDNNDFEYIELINTSDTETLDLTGVAFTNGIQFALPASTMLAPGQRILVVRDAAAFAARYDTTGMTIAGEYRDPLDGGNKLSNGGETLKLEDADSSTIQQFAYNDSVNQGWPAEPDGNGSSLEAVSFDDGHGDPATWNDYGESAFWYASPQSGGSPGVAATAAVLARHVFYEGSSFDTIDDDAIAPDKQPLLPGQTATPANYTNYEHGLNGLMIDLAWPADGAALGAGDFTLLVGNDDTPAAWSPADTSALVVTPRAGAGRGGSHRVVLTFSAGAPTNTWLQLTTRDDTPNTGLPAADVVYFGNAVGETGNELANALVTAADVIAVRDNARGSGNRADLANRFDFNRDALVDSLDALLARNAATGPFDVLRMITPALPLPPAPEGEFTPPTPRMVASPADIDAVVGDRRHAEVAAAAQSSARTLHALPLRAAWSFDRGESPRRLHDAPAQPVVADELLDRLVADLPAL